MNTVPMAQPENWMDLKPHPYSEIAEFGVGINLDHVVARMQEHGYDESEPIVIADGAILDGRHRHAAAVRAGVTPTFLRFEGNDAEKIVFVSKKLLRQHFDTSQRAMIAAKLATLPGGRPSEETKQFCAVFGISKADAAERMNVSERAVTHAKAVTAHGTEELQQAVWKKDVSVSDAAKIARKPAVIQNEAVKSVKEGEAPTVAAAAELLSVKCPRCTRTGSQVVGCGMCDRLRRKAKKKFDKEKRLAARKAKKPVQQQDGQDDFGNELPDNLRDAMYDPFIAEVIDFLETLSDEIGKRKYQQGMKKRAFAFPFIDAKGVVDGLDFMRQYCDQVSEHLKDRKPAGLHKGCNGKGCGKCRNAGLVPRIIYVEYEKNGKE